MHTRIFIGSEGSLGIISSVWLRVQPRPKYKASGTVKFADFFTGARAVQSICQAGLLPSNCRYPGTHPHTFCTLHPPSHVRRFFVVATLV